MIKGLSELAFDFDTSTKRTPFSHFFVFKRRTEIEVPEPAL